MHYPTADIFVLKDEVKEFIPLCREGLCNYPINEHK